jgi:hypothetical protein
LIFGAANFSGKMPMAWPTQAELDQTPFKGPDETGTQMGYFFGYREYDRRQAAGDPVKSVFPFGHGLSYSTLIERALRKSEIGRRRLRRSSTDRVTINPIPIEP